MRPYWAVLVFAGLLTAFANPTTAADSRSFVTIDVPGALVTVAAGITDSGQVVGFFEDAGKAIHGFLRTPTTASTIIDIPGASNTGAGGINGAGEIVGTFMDAHKVLHGFLRSSTGAYITFDVPGAVGTSATGISSGGLNRGMVPRCA
jgi:probable HAF family extracellular repeat protein